jgi:glycerol-3-phosphate dehydrogenase
MNLITRPLPAAVALGLESRSSKGRAPRLLFITPWRDRAVIGTAYAPYTGDPDRCGVTEEEIQAFLAEVNTAYPAARLARADVLGVHVGLLPASDLNGALGVARRYRIVDHARRDGVSGLLSVIGVKYTTARDVAEKSVDQVFERLERIPPRHASRRTPLVGGRIAHLATFLAETLRTKPAWVSEATMRRLVYCYGSSYPEVLSWAQEDPGLGGRLAGSDDVLRAEVVHAVHEEMAVRLADVVFRRTDLGCTGTTDLRAVEEAGAIMAEELGWSEAERRHEVAEVRGLAERWTPTVPRSSGRNGTRRVLIGADQ